jgi:hypothetical protein
MSGNRTVNFKDCNDINYVEKNDGIIYTGVKYINTIQDLADVEAKIQESIKQLQNQGMTVDDAKEQIANDMATLANTNSIFREKLLNWFRSLGTIAASELVKEVVRLAYHSAGL